MSKHQTEARRLKKLIRNSKIDVDLRMAFYDQIDRMAAAHIEAVENVTKNSTVEPEAKSIWGYYVLVQTTDSKKSKLTISHKDQEIRLKISTKCTAVVGADMMSFAESLSTSHELFHPYTLRGEIKWDRHSKQYVCSLHTDSRRLSQKVTFNKEDELTVEKCTKTLYYLIIGDETTEISENVLCYFGSHPTDLGGTPFDLPDEAYFDKGSNAPACIAYEQNLDLLEEVKRNLEIFNPNLRYIIKESIPCLNKK